MPVVSYSEACDYGFHAILQKISCVDVDGFCCKGNGDNYIIFYDDARTPKERINFTIAHELGHMQLHRDLNTVFMDTKTFNPHSRFERQANIFAVELLLPGDLLREYPDCTVYQLARSVGVPEEFVELKQL